MKNAWRPLATVCALVIGMYAYTAHSGFSVSTSLNAADAYYNLLVQGFRAGQLNLKKEVPPGLAQLADPYDPTAHALYGVLDLSYYKGKFYLYFGVTPAVLLFWPYVALTGHYLSQKDAGVIFCVVGFLASVGLLYALWRRYFAEVSVAVVAYGTLALGLATGVPVILSRCDVYEVAICCGYMLTMLALAAVWRALQKPERRWQWLAVASVACGLAVGARPSLLFGAIILLVPVVPAWHERRQIGAVLMAAIIPILLIGLGLMLYNELRFDNPFEFGVRTQLTWERQATRQFFGLRFLWFNFLVYFLEPAHWSARFPFVHEAAVPRMPPGYTQIAGPFGVLTNIPLVWLALATPLAWRRRSSPEASVLRLSVAATALLFGMCALTLGVFCASNFRYQVDFLPTLVLLAVIGILSLERALAPTSESGQACRQVWRQALRWGWGLLLVFSVAFNLFVSVERSAEARYNFGNALAQLGRLPEAIVQYQQALRVKPDDAEMHYDLGNALGQLGRVPEAMVQYQQVLRIKPADTKALNNLAVALAQTGKIEEAIAHFEQALRIKSDDAGVRYNLGRTLAQAGRVPEAIVQYQQALQIKPDFTDARDALARLQVGR